MVLEVAVVSATKKKSNVCHPDFGNRWNEKKNHDDKLGAHHGGFGCYNTRKKPRMTNLVLALNYFWKY